MTKRIMVETDDWPLEIQVGHLVTIVIDDEPARNFRVADVSGGGHRLTLRAEAES